MELNININNKENIDKYILLLSLGMIEALKQGLITLEEAQDYLFNPYFAGQLAQVNNMEMSELIYHSCELEDVKDIIPHNFIKSLNNLNNKLIGYLRQKGERTSRNTDEEKSVNYNFEL